MPRATNIIDLCQKYNGDPDKQALKANEYLTSLGPDEARNQLNILYDFKFEKRGREEKHVGYEPVEGREREPFKPEAPLQYAISRRNARLFQVMLSHGADPFGTYHGQDGKRLINGIEYFWQRAVESSNKEIIESLFNFAKTHEKPIAVMPEDIFRPYSDEARIFLLSSPDSMKHFGREDFVTVAGLIARGQSLSTETPFAGMELLLAHPRAPKAEILKAALAACEDRLVENTPPRRAPQEELSFQNFTRALGNMRHLESLFGAENAPIIRASAERIRQSHVALIEQNMAYLQQQAERLNAVFPAQDRVDAFRFKASGEREARR